ncbi:MAG: hypothetical protein L0322_03785, partial [Chloroflexi bacterium]|nr:hypothetical protein [Chloroflexota bacterium]
SPEQAAGQAATPASDVYSIGIILFELLTGRLPFEGENPAALAIKHLREAPPPVTRYNPAVPQQLERIIGKVLSKEQAGRYRTAEQLGRILTAYQQSSREETGPVSSTRRNPAGAAGQNVAERETVFYQQQTPPRGQRREEINPEPVTVHIPVPAREGTDWTAVSLGILALLSLLGLIPLWYIIYLRYTG